MYFYRLCLQKNGILGESQNKLFFGGGGGHGEAMVNTPVLTTVRPKIIIQIGITTVNFRQMENSDTLPMYLNLSGPRCFES